MESARDVQQHSNLLRKELGLGDLILAQILYVVGSGWTGTAARLGEQHLVFWLAAIVLFYLPLAVVLARGEPAGSVRRGENVREQIQPSDLR